MTAYLLTGMGLGLAAALSPGPLMVLIIAESLRGGWPAGFRVSMAPLVTDTTFVVVSLLIVSQLPGWAISAIGLFGGLFFVWMGVGTIRAAGVKVAAATDAPVGNPLLRGIATNLLNPYAFLFWLTAGGPLVREAYGGHGWAGPLAFMSAFYVVMIGTDLLIALGVSRSRQFLQGAGYRLALQGAGAALLGLGAWRVWQVVAALG